jgi:tetratricopeptide (TPR) repeat protein
MFIGDPGNLYRKFPDELSLAINYESNGLKDKKLEFYKKAYEDYPRDAHTHYNYALALYDMNQTETSIKILENLINTAPQYCHAYQTLIDIYKVRKNDNVDLYRVIDKMFNAYITNPNHFKSCAGINYKFCFTKLRDFVKLHGNNQRVLQISQVLSQMK